MPYGIDAVTLEAVPTWIWLILLIVGLLLCFFGELIWEFMISILGAIIGSTIGFALGFIMGGYLCAFGLMLVFAIIFSMLFQMLAKVAVALLCALLAFGGAVYLASEGGLTSAASLIVGLVVGLVVLIVAIFYVEEIVGVFLAAIGGFLVGVAVYFLVEGDMRLIYAGLAGGSMFVLGAVFQVTMQQQRKGARRRPPKRRPPRRARPTTRPAEQRMLRAKQTSPARRPSGGRKPPST